MTVPRRLARPHRFVVATREAADEARPDDYGRLQVRPREGVVRLCVSEAQVRRSLLLLEALFREAERRGYSVKSSASSWSDNRGVAIVVRGHGYAVRIYELLDQVVLTAEEIERWKKENKWRLSYRQPPSKRSLPNGRLKLALPQHFDGRRTNWTEGPRGALDTKLGAVLDEIARRADQDDVRDAKRAEEAAERQRLAELRLEEERLRRREAERGERLRQEAAAWRQAAELRAYIAALRDRLPALAPEEQRRLDAWCDWAERFADSEDPLVNSSRIARLNPSAH